MVEYIGYVGSLLVAVSLMMTNVWRLRWINLAGAAFFTAYGLLLHAWPVFGVNAFICGIDIWFIVAMATERDAFSALDVTQGDRQFLHRFVDFHRPDLERFFPDFELDSPNAPERRYIFVLRNLMPVGLFVYRPSGEDALEVLVDYVIPAYRDFENGAFLFSAQEVLRAHAWRAFVAHSNVPQHQRYLRRMGFRETAPGEFRRDNV